MNKEAQIWEKINEPKVEKIITRGKISIPELLKQIPRGKTAEIRDDTRYIFIIDRVPKITRQKKE